VLQAIPVLTAQKILMTVRTITALLTQLVWTSSMDITVSVLQV